MAGQVIRNADSSVQWGMKKTGNVLGFRRLGRASRDNASPHAQGARTGNGAEGHSSEAHAMSTRLEAIAERADTVAFAELFRHFAPRVRAYLLRGGGDAGQVDDVVQDTFATVWRKAGHYDRRRASAAAWIFAIARNRRIDVYRRERRPEFDPRDPAFQPDPLPDGERALTAVQRAEAVRTALDELSEEQREVLRLAFYEGETYAAIAVRLGIPLGTVKSRARLAFGHMRAALEARREALT